MNQLDGTIPAALGDLSRLEILYVQIFTILRWRDICELLFNGNEGSCDKFKLVRG